MNGALVMWLAWGLGSGATWLAMVHREDVRGEVPLWKRAGVFLAFVMAGPLFVLGWIVIETEGETDDE